MNHTDTKYLRNHPTVRRILDESPHRPTETPVLEAAWLREIALEAGADDVGCVGLERAEMASQRDDILQAFPYAKTLLSFVCRMNRENLRTPSRSIANLEFHQSADAVNQTGRRIVQTLERHGIRAAHTAVGFPMEADRWPARMWVISHKPVAEAAGLGRMGLHRNIIHPVFGSFILLGTVVLDARIDNDSRPIDYNPCLECKLCVGACPTGAIGMDGHFDFSACYTHNYREFMGGFSDWAETVAASTSASDYRKKIGYAESVSLWQSLSFGANYKAAYCLSVCPAGEDVVRPFLEDRRRFIAEVMRPLQDKSETVYVIAGSDAEDHVRRRFPHKSAKRVRNTLRPASIRTFLSGLPLVFQRGRASGLHATYHFSFTGEETLGVTVVIRDRTLAVREGLHGRPDFRITADGKTWLGFLAGEVSLFGALLRRKIRFKGPPRLLLAFGRCFPT
ncbi:SCP2 sterol-binding domain-containing protein [Methylococcus capsulatus]|uniref:SCP2 sterol-binding domain-containing protein n=1 Tax=Methylococcus capsulatus TaxID=414 RepID=UPI002FDAE0C1